MSEVSFKVPDHNDRMRREAAERTERHRALERAYRVLDALEGLAEQGRVLPETVEIQIGNHDRSGRQSDLKQAADEVRLAAEQARISAVAASQLEIGHFPDHEKPPTINGLRDDSPAETLSA